MLSVHFDGTGARLVTSGFDGSVRLWDARDGRSLAVGEGHVGGVPEAVFDATGLVWSLGNDGTLRAWDGARLLRLHAPHRGTVFRIWISADGTGIVSAARDGVAIRRRIPRPSPVARARELIAR